MWPRTTLHLSEANLQTRPVRADSVASAPASPRSPLLPISLPRATSRFSAVARVMGEVQRRKTVPPALLATLRMRPRSAAVARVVSPSRMGRTAPILRHRGPNRWVPAQQARTMERHALPRQHGGGLFDASCRDCARWGRACGWARDRALAGACRANVGAALAHALRELRGARCPGVRCLPAGYGAHQSGARLHAMRSSVWEPALYGMPRGRGRARPVSCRRGVRWASRTYRPCVQGRGRTAAIHRNRVHHALCRARGRAHGARTVRRASFAGGRGDVRPRDLIGIPTPRIRPHGGYRLRFCGCELPAAHRCLVKHGSLDQRELAREERLARSRGQYEVVAPVGGMRVLLLDDVITTGATMNAAAHALKCAGAARVDCLAFARVW